MERAVLNWDCLLADDGSPVLPLQEDQSSSGSFPSALPKQILEAKHNKLRKGYC